MNLQYNPEKKSITPPTTIPWTKINYEGKIREIAAEKVWIIEECAMQKIQVLHSAVMGWHCILLKGNWNKIVEDYVRLSLQANVYAWGTYQPSLPYGIDLFSKLYAFPILHMFLINYERNSHPSFVILEKLYSLLLIIYEASNGSHVEVLHAYMWQ